MKKKVKKKAVKKKAVKKKAVKKKAAPRAKKKKTLAEKRPDLASIELLAYEIFLGRCTSGEPGTAAGDWEEAERRLGGETTD